MALCIRILLSLVCVGVLLFCTFGFMATFEPLERSVQTTWRSIYGVVAVLSVAGLVYLNRRR
jgi:hypothetical protein